MHFRTKDAYLPLIDNVTHKYLREIMIGENLYKMQRYRNYLRAQYKGLKN